MSVEDPRTTAAELRSDAFKRMVEAIEAGDEASKANAIFDGAMAIWLEGDIEEDERLKEVALFMLNGLSSSNEEII
ncbi:MAG TPA: hypothetical protein VLH19_02825 [Patescibacteria group bacterium]|nr:hypothetical protein [Patescibacteria group bacterium]